MLQHDLINENTGYFYTCITVILKLGLVSYSKSIFCRKSLKVTTVTVGCIIQPVRKDWIGHVRLPTYLHTLCPLQSLHMTILHKATTVLLKLLGS